MTVMTAPPVPARERDAASPLVFANVLLRWRRQIIALGLAGGILGLTMGLTSTPVYKSAATFIPQGTETNLSGAAPPPGQLGIRLPTPGTARGPALYVAVLRSRSLLEPIAIDTVNVAEQGNQRRALMDLYEIDDPNPVRRLDKMVRRLQSIIAAQETRQISAVRVSV